METTVISPYLTKILLSLGLDKDQIQNFGTEDIGVSDEQDMLDLESVGELTVHFVRDVTKCNLVVAARIVNFFAFSNRDGRELTERFLSSLGEGISVGIPGFHTFGEGESFESLINEILPDIFEARQKKTTDPNAAVSTANQKKGKVVTLHSSVAPVNPEVDPSLR